jgi:acyl-CoA thioester hydrolase
MSAPAFRFAVRAEPSHIDELGHVNNTVYVAWAQEAGVRHWRSRAPAAMLGAFFWVASRLEIDFLAETREGEDLWIETWVEAPRGARFDRQVRIVGTDGRLRAAVRTTWALIDAGTRRPARVTKEMADLFAAPK